MVIEGFIIQDTGPAVTPVAEFVGRGRFGSKVSSQVPVLQLSSENGPMGTRRGTRSIAGMTIGTVNNTRFGKGGNKTGHVGIDTGRINCMMGWICGVKLQPNVILS